MAEIEQKIRVAAGLADTEESGPDFSGEIVAIPKPKKK